MTIISTGKYSILCLVGHTTQQAALFLLLDVLSLLWRKEYTFCEATALRVQTVEALAAFEAAFPVTELDIKLHNVVHLAEKLIAVGPLFVTSMFPYERTYRTLKNWIKNKQYQESTIMKTFCKFQQALIYFATGWSVCDGVGIFDINLKDPRSTAQMRANLYARYVDALLSMPVFVSRHPLMLGWYAAITHCLLFGSRQSGKN